MDLSDPRGDDHSSEALWLDEQEFIERIRRGDEAEYARMYARYFQPLWQFAYRYLRSEAVAEEIVQDVFLAIWVRRAEWRVQTTLRAYLYGAVRNRALHLVEHEQVVQRAESDLQAQAVSSRESSEETPDIQLENAELHERVARILAQLPERQHAAIMLRLVRGMTYSEIAEALGISVAAVGKLIGKAQEKLRQLAQGG